MTRDEILNMPAGRKMDALVAEKVMGQAFYPTYQNTTAGTYIPATPSYSVSIAAAWEVLEKLVIHDERNYYYLKPYTRGKKITIWEIGNGIDWDGNFVSSVEATTAPLAICRAALLATLEGE